jgi:hypothetical protein
MLTTTVELVRVLPDDAIAAQVPQELESAFASQGEAQ